MKYHKRKSIGSGELDALLQDWVRQSLNQPRRPEINLNVKRSGEFYVATFASRNGVARGICRERGEAISRCRLLGKTIS